MNPKITITPDEIRILRREVKGTGNLERLGFVTITDKAREFIARDDERLKQERAAGGIHGKRFGKFGGRPTEKGKRK